MTNQPPQDPGQWQPSPPASFPHVPPPGNGGTPPHPTGVFPAAGGWVAQPPKRTNPLMFVLIGAVALVLLCCGVATISAIVAPRADSPGQQDLAAEAVPSAQAEDTPPAPAATPTLSQQASPTPSPTPETVTRTVTVTKKVPYKTRTVKDSSLAKGTEKVRTRGVAGVKTLTYEVTVVDGVETERELIKSEVTKKPVTRVVRVGTKEAPRCDPNYAGACVPIASDVDCAGGSGNGPAYVEGPVRVIGNDIYDLDRDGDGIGCDR
ncbi:G5 domain-containing protein [Micromonospora maris]|uniref:G5 domain-containing protein n=1 Tax=Micromonospora maris TaxID=1003110 RepID=UPI002E0D3AB6|nr:G5 domain-containing protein [Micromonospora maris]